MKLPVFITTISLLLLSICVFGQNTKQNDDIVSINSIKLLHDSSVLLVRLQTKEKSIEAMKSSGKSELATRLELEQQALNQRIVNAFNENYTFSKVFFFYSDQSTNIKNENFDSVIFVNNNLQLDASIKPNLSNFFIAEFGIVSSETGLQGVMIRDKQFNQLRKPFPYYAKAPFFSSKSKSESKTVKRLNSKLYNYYNYFH